MKTPAEVDNLAILPQLVLKPHTQVASNIQGHAFYAFKHTCAIKQSRKPEFFYLFYKEDIHKYIWMGGGEAKVHFTSCKQ